MKKFFVLGLIFLLCISTAGCDIGSFLFKTHQGSIVLSSDNLTDADETSVITSENPSSKTPSKSPTSLVTTTSKVSNVTSTEFTVSKITTRDDEEAVEITVNKNEPTEEDDTGEQDTTPSIALPPSVEDLNDLLGGDTIEPEVSSSSSHEQSSSSNEESSSDTQTSDVDVQDKPKEHIPVSYEQRYRYGLLSLTEKVMYRQIVNAAEEFKYRVDFVQSHTFSAVATVIDAVIADNPHLFYLCSSCTVIHDGNNNARAICLKFSDSVKTNTDSDGYCTEVSNTLKSSILAKKTAFDSKTKSILSKIDPTLSDVQKEKIIYDTILKSADYNTSATWTKAVPNDWTAYGVLVNGKGVCESYSEAFQHLCLMAGINCTVIRGDAGGAHQWNSLKLDDEWYECDITFDDPINAHLPTVYHNYFNLTTQRMRELNHSADPNEPAPIATGTKYSYKNSLIN